MTANDEPKVAFKSAFAACLQEAKHYKQRRLFVISGQEDWCRENLSTLLAEGDISRATILSDPQFESDFQTSALEVFLDIKKASQLLGGDIDMLVYDGYAGFNPDAIGAAIGAVSAGGVIVLLAPELDQWHNFLDPDYRRLLVHPYKPEQLEHLFIKRVALSIQNSEGRWLYSQTKGLDTKTFSPKAIISSTTAIINDNCLSNDQSLAVDAVVKVVKGHRRRPLVLTSDRGRGKSSALGIASAQLIADSAQTIFITAPRLESVKPVFDHAARVLIKLGHQLTCEAGYISANGRQLKYITPDQLLRQLPKVDLLLIDEAAAIPLPMLHEFVQRYSRVVFSSTVHGYEGSGRGFGLRFFKQLDESAPHWKKIELKQAIRWRDDDPVEAWVFDALLLNAEYRNRLADNIVPDQCEIRELERRDLARNEELLRQVFALLVLAHYQTTPGDLRNLLDGPNIRIWVVLHKKSVVVATALVTDEGGFSEQLSTDVWKGKRRLRGHMLPQTLAAHSGIEIAPKLSYQRIMRIAVQPDVQQKGIGQALLASIHQRAEEQGIDIVGSSFGVTEDVLHFWQRAGYSPVRLGVGRDACSGTHSALVLKSNSLSGEILLDTVRFRFLDHFPHQLLTIFNGLEPEIVAGLMLANDYYDAVVLDEQDWLDVIAFSEGYRVLEVCAAPLWKLVCSFMGQLEVRQWLSNKLRDLLIYLLLQNRPIPWVAKKLDYSGRKELLNELRAAIGILSKQQTFLRSTSIH